MKIIVNGKEFDIEEEEGSPSLSYADVIKMAGYAPDRIVSVTYRWQGEGDHSRSAILAPRQLVTPAEGMVFSVARTG